MDISTSTFQTLLLYILRVCFVQCNEQGHFRKGAAELSIYLLLTLSINLVLESQIRYLTGGLVFFQVKAGRGAKALEPESPWSSTTSVN